MASPWPDPTAALTTDQSAGRIMTAFPRAEYLSHEPVSHSFEPLSVRRARFTDGNAKYRPRGRPHFGPFPPHVSPAETENGQAPFVTDGSVGPLARLGKNPESVRVGGGGASVPILVSVLLFPALREINRERPNFHRRFSAKHCGLSNLISALCLFFRAV